MPILKYTTQIAASKTIGEIMETLSRAGASMIAIDYNQDKPPMAVALLFAIFTEGVQVSFRLDCRWREVLHIMDGDKGVPKRLRTPAQAQKVAWRIIKAWIEAQMAYIEAGQADLPQLFFPHAVGKDGRLLYDKVMDQYLLLPNGDNDESES